jgi:hypothetical protein
MGQAAPAEKGSGLTELQTNVLMFERQWWRYEGSKEQAVRELFGLDPVRYYQLLSGLIDSDEALAFDPYLVARLRRGREERHRTRSARRLELDGARGPTDRL